MAKLYTESNTGDTTYFNASSHEILMGMIHDLLVSSSGWCTHICSCGDPWWYNCPCRTTTTSTQTVLCTTQHYHLQYHFDICSVYLTKRYILDILSTIDRRNNSVNAMITCMELTPIEMVSLLVMVGSSTTDYMYGLSPRDDWVVHQCEASTSPSLLSFQGP